MIIHHLYMYLLRTVDIEQMTFGVEICSFPLIPNNIHIEEEENTEWEEGPEKGGEWEGGGGG